MHTNTHKVFALRQVVSRVCNKKKAWSTFATLWPTWVWPRPPLLHLGLFFEVFQGQGQREVIPYGKASLHCSFSRRRHLHFIFLHRLVGDVLLCTGFLSYLGPFNQIFRNYLLKDQWELELKARKIPFTENLNLIAMLVDPPTVSLTLASRIRISALV